MTGAVAIGIDIGGTTTKIGRVTTGAVPPDVVRIETAAHHDPNEFLETVMRLVDEQIETDVSGLGVSLAGLLSEDRRSIAFNPNIPALEGVDFVDLFSRFGLPISIEQDLNAVALGEFHSGAGRGAKRLMGVSIGTGLGAALLLDGEPVRFAAGATGDTGHVILDAGGRRCTVGCHGCAEAFVSTAGLAAAVPRQHIVNAGDAGDVAQSVTAAAYVGTDWAVEAISTVGRYLGQWLASIAPIFLPDRIVLSGGVAEAGVALIEPCEQRFRELTGPKYAECQLALGTLRSVAGVVGSAVPFLAGS